MSDTDNNNGTVEIEAAEKVQSIGQVLQAARLVHGMNIQDVARQLRLSAWQVAAIEEDDYSKFPSRTFLRGFIRNYAKLVQVGHSGIFAFVATNSSACFFSSHLVPGRWNFIYI